MCNPVIHTGSNSPSTAVAIIPSRYSSTRLPGKALLEIAGKPLVVWVAERTQAAATISRVMVATDDSRIAEAVAVAGFEPVLTRSDHLSGTDRIAEVAQDLTAEIIVNVQGDEPLINPETIDRAVAALIEDSSIQMSTSSEPINDVDEVFKSSVVKVAVDASGCATNFSRNAIPFPNQAVQKYGSIEAALRQEPALLSSFRKHTGLYAYRREFLLQFAGWPTSERERQESLEQLRALERGVRIKVIEAASPSIGVDTMEDLELVRTTFGETIASAR